MLKNMGLFIFFSMLIYSSFKMTTSFANVTRFTSCTNKKKIFLFNGKFYDQIDGIAMGSPLAPVLANLFMGHNDKL